VYHFVYRSDREMPLEAVSTISEQKQNLLI
jgi:hypothetical protein